MVMSDIRRKFTSFALFVAYNLSELPLLVDYTLGYDFSIPPRFYVCSVIDCLWASSSVVEQRTLNPQVVGSTPTGPTIRPLIPLHHKGKHEPPFAGGFSLFR